MPKTTQGVLAAFAGAAVANEPPADFPGLTAEKTAATISIFDDEGNPLIDRKLGRWSASKQAHERDRIGYALDHLAEDIDPNGIPHPLDVAMKYPNDEDCFFYNDDNNDALDGRLAVHRLCGSWFRVEITVRPAKGGVPVTESFVLTNAGSGGEIKLAVAD